MKKFREYLMKEESVILALKDGRQALAKSHRERREPRGISGEVHPSAVWLMGRVCESAGGHGPAQIKGEIREA